MNETDFIRTDILIIGSGLAGLRCGISALEEDPKASVLIVTKGSGPVGSSFTNINNALGMQICLNDEEKEKFVKKAESIALPGFINTKLTEIMAEESQSCFNFLKNNNIDFNRSENGELIRYTGCFYPEIKGAYVFKNLRSAFTQLKNKFLSLSGTYVDNQSVLHLLNEIGNGEKTIRGAVFVSETTDNYTIINARTTILASGGTTPLFQWNVGGHSLSGYSPALLKNSGVTIINPEFHQFIWHHPKTLQPVYPSELLKNGAIIRSGNNLINKIPDEILSLIPDRETHVPAAYGLPDTEIEKYLLSFSNKDGVVTFVLQNNKEIQAVLCAHAWNGGAKIDKNGWTGIPGLFTCGECAGGMHGANRIGGAMVLATLVFGKKAGISAARKYKDYPDFNQKECMDSAARFMNSKNNLVSIDALNTLKQLVYQSSLKTLLTSKKGLKSKLEITRYTSDNTSKVISRLLYESALIISPDLGENTIER